MKIIFMINIVGYPVRLFVCVSVCEGHSLTQSFFSPPILFVCVHYNSAVPDNSVYPRGYGLLLCEFARSHTHRDTHCSRAGRFSALSFSNDNYPSMVGALLWEMKMDGISVECSGRCIAVATRNYTVRTIEPPSTRR